MKIKDTKALGGVQMLQKKTVSGEIEFDPVNGIKLSLQGTFYPNPKMFS